MPNADRDQAPTVPWLDRPVTVRRLVLIQTLLLLAWHAVRDFGLSPTLGGALIVGWVALFLWDLAGGQR